MLSLKSLHLCVHLASCEFLSSIRSGKIIAGLIALPVCYSSFVVDMAEISPCKDNPGSRKNNGVPQSDIKAGKSNSIDTNKSGLLKQADKISDISPKKSKITSKQKGSPEEISKLKTDSHSEKKRKAKAMPNSEQVHKSTLKDVPEKNSTSPQEKPKENLQNKSKSNPAKSNIQLDGSVTNKVSASEKVMVVNMFKKSSSVGLEVKPTPFEDGEIDDQEEDGEIDEEEDGGNDEQKDCENEEREEGEITDSSSDDQATVQKPIVKKDDPEHRPKIFSGEIRDSYYGHIHNPVLRKDNRENHTNSGIKDSLISYKDFYNDKNVPKQFRTKDSHLFKNSSDSSDDQVALQKPFHPRYGYKLHQKRSSEKRKRSRFSESSDDSQRSLDKGKYHRRGKSSRRHNERKGRHKLDSDESLSSEDSSPHRNRKDKHRKKHESSKKEKRTSSCQDLKKTSFLNQPIPVKKSTSNLVNTSGEEPITKHETKENNLDIPQPVISSHAITSAFQETKDNLETKESNCFDIPLPVASTKDPAIPLPVVSTKAPAKPLPVVSTKVPAKPLPVVSTKAPAKIKKDLNSNHNSNIKASKKNVFSPTNSTKKKKDKQVKQDSNSNSSASSVKGSKKANKNKEKTKKDNETSFIPAPTEENSQVLDGLALAAQAYAMQQQVSSSMQYHQPFEQQQLSQWVYNPYDPMSAAAHLTPDMVATHQYLPPYTQNPDEPQDEDFRVYIPPPSNTYLQSLASSEKSSRCSRESSPGGKQSLSSMVSNAPVIQEDPQDVDLRYLTTPLQLPGQRNFHSVASSDQSSRVSSPCVEESFSSLAFGERQWQTVAAPEVKSPGSLEFTVMSYNILSQDLLEQHPHLYHKCKEKDLDWETRADGLLQEILFHYPDVICLQEVQADHFFSHLREPLEVNGYGCFYKQKTGAKTDGCAVFYKQEKFSLIKEVPVELKKGGLLDRDNVGAIILLKPRCDIYNGKVDKVCIATTHLLFNPRRGDVKLAQLAVLLAEIDKHAQLDVSGQLYDPSSPSYSDREDNEDYRTEEQAQPVYCPIIFTGDFNAEPFSDFYYFITSGELEYKGCLSNLLCGQEEGRYGRDKFLSNDLLPNHLKITENCQFEYVEKRRKCLIDQRRSESVGAVSNTPQWATNTGRLRHFMNLKSAYKHFLDPALTQEEISTHHSKASCTVDYIFYSSNRPSKSSQRQSSSQDKDSSLTLLSRYRLLSKREVAKNGHMPNAKYPSDHLCLIAKFLLR